MGSVSRRLTSIFFFQNPPEIRTSCGENDWGLAGIFFALFMGFTLSGVRGKSCGRRRRKAYHAREVKAIAAPRKNMSGNCGRSSPDRRGCASTSLPRTKGSGTENPARNAEFLRKHEELGAKHLSSRLTNDEVGISDGLCDVDCLRAAGRVCVPEAVLPARARYGCKQNVVARLNSANRVGASI